MALFRCSAGLCRVLAGREVPVSVAGEVAQVT